ncbi:hypothetical protein SLS56_010537 [Neofusicoccum ribis]|uniref:Uncharacterized protein n=1 Tax=Neofusicoccum ribis TaxID=45134 RepID=A0ABR3SE42_9PEZI
MGDNKDKQPRGSAGTFKYACQWNMSDTYPTLVRTLSIPMSLLYKCCEEDPGPFYPTQVQPTDISMSEEWLNIGFERGGRRFEVSCPAAIFSHAGLADAKGRLDEVHAELVAFLVWKFREELDYFTRSHLSLACFLHIYDLLVLIKDGKVCLTSPVRGSYITDTFFQGIPCSDKDLPWLDWDSITVLERLSETRFQVLVDGERHACYMPNRHEEYQDPATGSILLEQVQAWKRTLQTAGFTKHNIPQLTGFVYSLDRPQLLQGLLYEWIEPCKTNPTLSQVNIHRVPML